MERIIYRKTLDVHKNGIQFLLQGFETADVLSRVIEISLMASGDTIDFPLERVMAMMYVTTPSATEPSIIECAIKDNKVVYKVLPIIEEGITTMQLKIIETSPEGAKSVLAAPKFAVEVTKSNADDESAKQTVEFTALEDAVAKAKTVYDERFLRLELDSECVFKAWYADGTYYETDLLQKLFRNGNVLLSESFAKGGTGIRSGEDTDNSMYYSNLSRSEALNAKNIMANSEKVLEEVKLHGVYTAFTVNFETGDVEYVSPSFHFKINLETGELEATGQTYSFSDEVGRIVEEWLLTNNIILSDLQAIATTHNEEIATNAREISTLKDRVTPIEKGGTGVKTLSDLKSILTIDKLTPIPSYLAFVGNVNANLTAAAFGKGNEDEMLGIGKALKMYANFKGNTENVDFLDGYDKYTDLVADHKQKLIANTTLYTLIKSNTYAKDVVVNTNSRLPDIVLYDAGFTEYLDLANATLSGYTNGNYVTRSMDVTNGLINLTGNNTASHCYGSIQGYACLCTIPLIQPIPNLRGYRHLRVKFADDVASSIRISIGNKGHEDELNDSCHVTVAGKQYVIGPFSSTKDLTALTFSNDFFDTYANNPSAENIKIGIYHNGYGTSAHYGTINIEKIWISET